MLTTSLPLSTAALLMILVAAAVGVCGWVGGIDRIWFIAGVGAAMMALFTAGAMLPHPTVAAARAFPYWFLGAFLVALALQRHRRLRRAGGEAAARKPAAAALEAALRF